MNVFVKFLLVPLRYIDSFVSNSDYYFRIKYQDYKQNEEALFANANMGEHKYGVVYVMKLL